MLSPPTMSISSVPGNDRDQVTQATSLANPPTNKGPHSTDPLHGILPSFAPSVFCVYAISTTANIMTVEIIIHASWINIAWCHSADTSAVIPISTFLLLIFSD